MPDQTSQDARLATLEAQSLAADRRMCTLEARLARLSLATANTLRAGRLATVAGGAGHGTDDGEYISFSEWADRKAGRYREDDWS